MWLLNLVRELIWGSSGREAAQCLYGYCSFTCDTKINTLSCFIDFIFVFIFVPKLVIGRYASLLTITYCFSTRIISSIFRFLLRIDCSYKTLLKI